MLWMPTDNAWFLYVALGVIVVGNGLFKPNAGNLVRKIYEGDDTQDRQRLHHLLHGGQHRLDDLDAADAVDQRLRRPALRRRPGAGTPRSARAASAWCIGLINYTSCASALSHIGSAPDDRPLNVRRLAGVLVVGALCVVGSAFILQNETVALVFVYTAGVVMLGIFIYLIPTAAASSGPA